MITETLIATLSLLAFFIGARGIKVNTGQVVDLFVAFYICFVSAIEVVTAVNLAATNAVHIGGYREVSYLVLAGGILAMWKFPAWFMRPRESAS